MADLVEDVKSRLGIYDVVSQYVQLKKSGRSYKGLCPFHGEKTPSFMVSPEKQICHCFGCSKGGDIFTFIQEVEGVEFSEALSLLADRAGLKVEDYKSSFKPEKNDEKKELYKAHDLAAEFFEKQLFSTSDGKKVLEYLKRRGVNDDTIKTFRLGFSPNKYDALYPYLLKKGVRKQILIKSGFVSSKSTNYDDVYDKFRGRLMFPIFDVVGRVCGFGGRALAKGQIPKYLNSPENSIYNKSKLLYGLSHSKKYIKEEKKVLLVEGYFDVILPYQEGIKFVVASSGTALTSEQAKLIKRFTDNVVTCFDSDNAGFEATVRSYTILRDFDLNIKTVSVMKGKDPADFVREDKDGFLNVVTRARGFLVFFIDKLVKNNNIHDLDGKNIILKEILPYLKLLSPVEKDFYVRYLAKKLEIDEGLLYDEIQLFSLPKILASRKKSEGRIEAQKRQRFSNEEILISVLIEFPNLFSKVKDFVLDEDFSGAMKIVYNTMLSQYNASRQDQESWDFKASDLAEHKQKIELLSLYAEERYSSFPKEVVDEEVDKLLAQFKKTCKRDKLKSLERDISEAEKGGEKEKLMGLLLLQQKILSNN